MKTYTVYKRIAPDGRIYVGTTSTSLEWRAGKNGIRYMKQKRLAEAIREYGWESFRTEIVAEGLTKEQAGELENQTVAKYETTNPNKGFNVLEGGFHCATIGEFEPGNIPWNKGIKWQTDEEIAKRIKAAASANRGKTHSPEWRKHISESQVKKPVLQYSLNGEMIAEYKSAREASRITGCSFQKIGAVALGKRLTSGGYIWKFKEGETR